ncbi:MAG: hypothetical protein AABY10_05715 [Nanoarchaeota archaeon]
MERKVGVLLFVLSLVFIFSLSLVNSAGSSDGGSSGSDIVIRANSSITNTTTNNSVVSSSDSDDLEDEDELDDDSSDELETGNVGERIKERLKVEYKERLKTLRKSCDDLSERKDRIKCRLALGKEYVPKVNLIPEGCLRAASPQACKRLYEESAGCFELKDKEKNACFRRVSGFVKEKITNETEDRGNKTRNLVVLMLYDLQERVEKANELGKITADESTSLIDKIVEIKQAVLSGKTKEEIRTMMQELRLMWRSSII